MDIHISSKLTAPPTPKGDAKKCGNSSTADEAPPSSAPGLFILAMVPPRTDESLDNSLGVTKMPCISSAKIKEIMHEPAELHMSA